MNNINYFKAVDGEIYGFDEDQISLGLSEKMKRLTDLQLESILNQKLTPEQINKNNIGEQNFRLEEAGRMMAPFLMALQLGIATIEETEKAKEWQAYYRSLIVVDLKSGSPGWPDRPY